MKKVDRLGWAAGLSFQAYGLRIGIRANAPEVLDDVREHLPPGWRPAPSPVVDYLYSVIKGKAGRRSGVRRYNLLYAGPTRMARSMDMGQVFDILRSNLNLYIAERARRRLFVHAGVVAWRGRAIVLPGDSYTGKTTLVAALVRAGATYYSDEYAVLDARGRVHPYPLDLSIRKGKDSSSRRVPLEILGGVPGDRPLPVGLVVFTRYQRGKSWRPRRISPGRTVLGLLTHTVPARRRPKSVMSTLGLVAAQAPALKGLRGGAGKVVDRLLKSCESPTVH